MKPPSRKWMIRLAVLSLVLVGGAIAVAQVLPLLRRDKSPQEQVERPLTGGGPATTPSMRPIAVQVDPPAAQAPLAVAPTASSEDPNPALSPPADDRFDTGSGPDWAESPGTSPQPANLEASGGYRELPTFDDAPVLARGVDARETDTSDTDSNRPALASAGAEDDPLVHQPPPLLDSSTGGESQHESASLDMADDRAPGRLPVDPLPAAQPTEPATDDPAGGSARRFSRLRDDRRSPQLADGDAQLDEQPSADTAAKPADDQAVLTRPLESQPSPAALSAPGPAADPDGPGAMPADALGREGASMGSQTAALAGKPGPAELEGPRTPTLTVEKLAPPEIRVGATAQFLVKVRNTGQVAADRVVVQDEVPHGTKLVSTVPQAERLPEGGILWQLGTVKPGEEVTVTMEVAPLEEGQIGSVATVSFQTSASARALATKPQLQLEQTAPRSILVGQDVVFSIRLSNPGTGSAANVVLVENVPEGLQHSAGSQLEYEVGTLKPGESRQLELTLKADRPGVVDNLLVARADANLTVRDSIQIDVVAPQLHVEVDGPPRRYLQREATFTVAIQNPGTAPADDVQLIAHLPRGLKFVNTNNAGYYDQAGHTVHWNLEQLPPQEMGSVQLTVMPTELGAHKIRAAATAQMGLSHAAEKDVLIEGLAALLFTVVDMTDPIEVGSQTSYEIRVVNQGTKEATNVQLIADVPAGMQAIGGDGPSRAVAQPQRVTFDPLPTLAPQADALYKIHVQGQQPGDMRFRVQLTADEVNPPVIKEESTRVYADP